MLRVATVVQDSVNREERSIRIVLATERAVQVYDMSRMEVVDEIIRLEGMDIPAQVPMIDSHGRQSVSNVLGSIRDFKVENGELTGRAYFANDEVSRSTFDKYADGHLTDFSVGARTLERKYKGRVKSITRSQLIEGSAVVVGADRDAKALVAQRAYAEPEEVRKETMNKELMAMLVERGLDEKSTDKQILEFLERELQKDESGIDPLVALEVVRSLKDSLTEKPAEKPEAKPDPVDEVKRAQSRWNAIDELCRNHEVADDVRRGYLDGEQEIDAVASDILKRTFKPTGLVVGPGQQIQHGAASRDKFYDAAEYSIVNRSLGGIAVDEELQRDIGEAPAGAAEMQYKRIPDIAREMCERAGVNIVGLPPQEIISRAISMPDFVQRSSGGPAFHTTGSFSNLFLNAMHKTLRASYNEAASTYQHWVRTAPDAVDFKNMDKIVFGEMGLPEEVAENGEYPEMTASDGKETYKVAKHGGIFSITMEMMVNDDLGAMTRKVQMQGNSMRRKINRDAYAILLDNDNLSDSIALFHASSHGANLDATALSETALDVGFNIMGTQAGLNSTTVLGLRPKYLIVPAGLGATAQRLVTGGILAATVANVPLYGAGAPRSLTVIEDGQIDALGTTTNWWLAADNSAVDTVEVSFLQGERTPALSREDGFSTDTIKAKIRQTYGFKAIDYRGLYQGNA